GPRKRSEGDVMKKCGMIALVLASACLASWTTAMAVARAGDLAQPSPAADAAALSTKGGGRSADRPLRDAPGPATPAPGGALAASDCVGCHPRAARGAGALSHLGAAGPSDRVSCVDCHGSDHRAIVAAHGRVAAGACGHCHPEEYGG
ncbi:MAG: hypothetical protein WC709_12860, partial [Thermoleophilia bacterium]